MRKTMLSLMLAAVLLLCALPALAGEDTGPEDQIYMVWTWTNVSDPLEGVPDAALDLTQEERGRAVQAALMSSRPFILVLPEGEAPADYAVKALYILLEEPLDVKEGGDLITLNTAVDVVRPIWVEDAGHVEYGIITEIDKDYVVLDAYEENMSRLTGSDDRYVITPETLFSFEAPFEKGSGCMVLVDAEGNALALIESNG